MATQRITIAEVGGDAGAAVARLFRKWADSGSGSDLPDAVRDEIDRFAVVLREGAADLPVLYFCEWTDHWLMGDDVLGPGAVGGKRFEASCYSPAEAEALAASSPRQFPEQEWLATRLREAAGAWGSLVSQS